MKEFILIDHEPWTLRRKQLFYDLFEAAGISLEVWDLSQWLYPGLKNPEEIAQASYLHKIGTEYEFVDLLRHKTPSNTIFVEEIFHQWQNRNIFKHLSKYGFYTIKIELYGNTIIQQSLWDKILNLKLNQLPKMIVGKINSIKFKMFNRINGIDDCPTLLFSSNAFMPHTNGFNHPDYEKLMFNEVPRIIENDYIVFCDIYSPYHSDLTYFLGLKKFPDGKKYQERMRTYFDFLEEKYNIPVVIAAHPKSNYKGGEFGNRKIIKYHTDSLVKYSKMVTMHICNTISYAILCNKPIAYVVTDDYLSLPNIQRQLKVLVNKILGLDYYNIDDAGFESKFSFAPVDSDKRNKYIYSYLTSKETAKIPNSQTLYKALSAI